MSSSQPHPPPTSTSISTSTSVSTASSSPYPFATAPDIVRAHQKDAYFTGHLTNTITDLYRRLFGARSSHALAPELRSLAALLYFSLTTLPGNRTLGEEYCDLVQIESPHGQLPDIKRRAAYIGGTILLPYLVSRTLPQMRNRLRRIIDIRLERLRRRGKQESIEARIWEYISNHLPSLTSAAPIQAVTLALFYFNGTYYELTKRLLSLRYVFTRTVPDSPDRGGYEVLGVLLVIQLAVQGYLHVRSTVSSVVRRERNAFPAGTVDVSLDHTNSYSANSDLLLTELGNRGPQQSRVDLASTTHTPVSTVPRFDLGNDKLMGYIKGSQQRKCTLCLEELKDPSATQCGHVFCWECIGDWVREKPECPLCRREAMVQHILPLRVM
ncbi:peroxisome biogenesis factor 10 [Conoideocrella luteorostrata]|uniref:RING-type E3 ubiquitin transferase n=1 Tax=Conoideocrella luteorostrata TaxID=1105319 RepID=A0AAJ0CCS2_9HYPO|nr:peroxisome biogenesis factor 10 [Conoideocrella luteorostrata]